MVVFQQAMFHSQRNQHKSNQENSWIPILYQTWESLLYLSPLLHIQENRVSQSLEGLMRGFAESMSHYGFAIRKELDGSWILYIFSISYILDVSDIKFMIFSYVLPGVSWCQISPEKFSTVPWQALSSQSLRRPRQMENWSILPFDLGVTIVTHTHIIYIYIYTYIYISI